MVDDVGPSAGELHQYLDSLSKNGLKTVQIQGNAY